MCEFVSTVEVKGGRHYFLTGNQVFRTAKGKALRDYCGSTDDLTGHGAIRHYYGLRENEGINQEYTDFSSPNNFPPEVAQAIKSGAMRGLAIVLDLLLPSVLPEYDKTLAKYNKALAEYGKAWAEYDKALAKYNKAWAEYDKALAEYGKAWAEYDKALAKYNKALAKYNKAWAEYDKALAAISQEMFWSLFAKPENRAPAWR